MVSTVVLYEQYKVDQCYCTNYSSKKVLYYKLISETS